MSSYLPLTKLMIMKAGLILISADISHAATLIDVSQLLVPTRNDYGAGSGQIFTPSITGSLEGISLYLFKAGNGADVVLTVHTLNDLGTAFNGTVATATIKASLISTAGNWVYFDLKAAISQTSDVPLAFTVDQPGSAASGYVNYGDNLTNPYGGGSFLHSTGSNYSLVPGTDLGFQTTVSPIPEPSAAILVSIASTGMQLRRRRQP